MNYEIIVDAIHRRLFPGCALALFNGKKEEVVCKGSLHFPEMEPKPRPVHPGTLYDLSSLTKVFVFLALLRLIGIKRLFLEDPIASILPFKEKGDIQKMTIIDLLTCGLDFVLPPDLEKKGIHLKEGTSWRFFNEARLKGPLGTMFRYGNPSAFMAGEILERVMETDLESVLSELVFEPLQLKDTSFKMPEGRSHRVAPTQVVTDPSRWQYGEVQDPMSKKFLPKAVGIAGLFSNITDMLKVAKVLATNLTPEGRQFLPHWLWKEMVSDQYEGKEEIGGVTHRYGLGLDKPHPGYVDDEVFCQNAVFMAGFSGTFIVGCHSWKRGDLSPRSIGWAFLSNTRRDMKDAAQVHRTFRQALTQASLDSITE